MKVFEVPPNPQNPSNKQKGPSEVNLVDSIPSVEVYATSHPAVVEVNATKRPGTNEPGPSRPPPNLRTNLVPPVVAAPNVANGVASNVVPPMMTLPSLINPVRARKPVRRRPVRRLPISIRRHDVWRKLDEVNAGLSMTEWLMLDSQASSDLMDGVRTMRSRRKKVTSGPDGRQTVTVKPSKPKSNNVAPMVVGAVDRWDDGQSDWEDHTDDSSEFSEVSSEDSKGDEELESTTESTDLEQAGSHTGYPYDLHELRRSAPLKGPVSVNGIVFECTFDSGAAVSVMSEALAQRLGLKYNGDQIHLTSFDSLPREPCNIVPNVPIRVGGHLRAEHMCIQASPHRSQDEYCILGMTWFRNYGASIRAQDNIVTFPTSMQVNGAGVLTPDWSGGMMEVQCYSSHDGDGLYSYSSTGAEANTSIGRSQVLVVSVAKVDGATHKEEVKMDLTTYIEEVAETSDQELTEDVPFCLDKVPEWLQDLVASHKETFVEVSGLGRVDLATHEIPTLPGTTPIKSRPFRLTWDEQAQMAKELEEMMKMELIRPSKGVWSSPCFFIRKKDGSLRLVIDYRRLNKLTIKDNYPLPMIDTVLDSLAGATIFTTLDAASGNHQVPMEPMSMAKTGFVTPQGTFEFQVMPFGLTSAPATYQRMMANLLGPYLNRFVMVFIDDVIVFSRNQDDHKMHLKLVLDRCQEANLKLKFKKCHFGSGKVEYLGHTISGEGVSPHAHNTDKITNFPTPRNADEVRSFLGTAGYYRRFIDRYADIAVPLTNMLKKNKNFKWGESEEEAFRVLQQRLVNAPVLAYPDRQQIQILTTDASNNGISAILSQSPDGSAENEKVISYNSRTLRGPEVGYSAVHQEAAAIIWAVNKYRHYLMGRYFKLRTDNAALTYIMSPSKPSPKLSRWAACLMEYDYDIVHLPGVQNPADSLSRLFPV